ncbi:MAG: cbb3-type cytochrome oxidase assembly protein CcoS [Pseudomonadales bacterium]
MEVLALLIPLSIVLVGAALWFFIWATDNDQFEDLDHHAMDIFDDTEGNS